ncbi:Leukotriene A-4 hydrolase [Sarcoptes scabiei]|uniref:Leukotriene A-4 hydrolase n=1 Tax=Sarcoptes scabiei TaxID=52283 RepID=A0A834RH53_SARSC|nr:Leukotriene A-4 hydrolase [Sarcoptes scabiei]
MEMRNRKLIHSSSRQSSSSSSSSTTISSLISSDSNETNVDKISSIKTKMHLRLCLALSSIIVFVAIIFLFRHPNWSLLRPFDQLFSNHSVEEKNVSSMFETNLDPNSYSRPDQAKITHLNLRLEVNFETKTLNGSVIANITKIDPLARVVIFDTYDLKIHRIQLLTSEFQYEVPYHLYPFDESFGSKLEVAIDKALQNEFQIQIDYETDPTSRALMWMDPAQTDGKKFPFMYSQCQAINARSMIPCQDTPSVKATYSAEIIAAASLQVLMSAKISKSPIFSPNSDRRTHFFLQNVPIPSYLIAIAVGDLVHKKIGKISNVWSEPGLIESAAWEFAEIDKILEKAESLAGEYVWGIYDILVLPPSFPYGGMENPCLTFATPTLLAGDRSLVYVIAHEISHSWTGNLVTNANFGHFWLNEGFTTFLEYKISGRMDTNGEKFRHLMALEGLEDLKEAVKYYGDDSPLTKLLIDVRKINPDDAFSSIPYQKGHTFLFYLEQKLGGPEIFEPFLRAYIDHFKYDSIITKDFQDFIYDYFGPEILDTVEWDKWFHDPGMPPIIPAYDQTLLMHVIDLSTKWLNASLENINEIEFPLKQFDAFQSLQKKLFFIQLSNRKEESNLDLRLKLAPMSQIYRLNSIGNCEVRFAWIMLGLEVHYEEVIGEAVDFVSTYGRMKYITPLYRKLYRWEKTKQLALKTFEKNKPKMMRVAIDAIAKDLYGNKS